MVWILVLLRALDLRELISWIALSKPYSFSSRRTSKTQKDDPQLGEQPQFTHFYLWQMRAEALYESLLAASGNSGVQGSYEEKERQKNVWLSQFASAFGTDEGFEWRRCCWRDAKPNDKYSDKRLGRWSFKYDLLE